MGKCFIPKIHQVLRPSVNKGSRQNNKRKTSTYLLSSSSFLKYQETTSKGGDSYVKHHFVAPKVREIHAANVDNNELDLADRFLVRLHIKPSSKIIII